MFLGGGVRTRASTLPWMQAGMSRRYKLQLIIPAGSDILFYDVWAGGPGFAKGRSAVWLTVIGGMAAGLVTVAVTGLIFSQMKRLQTDGTINIQNTIGQEGSVYLTIPKNGTGQVQIIVQGSLKIFDAVSKSKNVIATGEKVQV
jgi:hypothetical protein